MSGIHVCWFVSRAVCAGDALVGLMEGSHARAWLPDGAGPIAQEQRRGAWLPQSKKTQKTALACRIV